MRLYNCLAIKERRFKWNNHPEYTGYVGVGNGVSQRIEKKHGFKGSRVKDRFELNKHYAEQFYGFYIKYGPEYAVKQWHREHELWSNPKYNKQAVDYWKEIKKILRYCNENCTHTNGN
jgi:hypothetical protein